MGLTREEAVEQLERLGRERLDLSPVCDIFADLLRTWIANERAPMRKRGGRPMIFEDRPLTNAERSRRWREKKKHALREPALTEVGDGGRRKEEG